MVHFHVTVRLLSIPLLVLHLPAQGSAVGAKVAWLAENGVAIQSLDPEDSDFSDLMPLVEKIGDARVVLLGEASHGDGASFLARSRLVRFLHEEMGFNVLAWESGLFDCQLMQEALAAGKDPVQAAEASLFRIWGESGQTHSLFQYLQDSQASANPLWTAGFDCQISGPKTQQEFSAAVLAFCEKVGGNFLEEDERALFTDFQQNLVSAMRQGEAGRVEFLRRIDLLRDKLSQSQDARSVHGAVDVARMDRILAGFHAMLALAGGNATGTSFNNPRDQMMAENLAWLAREQHAGEKIIVWGASFHLIRHVDEIVKANINYEGTRTMGQVFSEIFDEPVYTIAVVAHGGQAGIVGNQARDLPEPPPDSFEALCMSTGLQALFVDLKALPEDHWLQDEMSARPLGHGDMRSRWPRHLDAFLFLDEMSASTRESEVPVRWQRR